MVSGRGRFLTIFSVLIFFCIFGLPNFLVRSFLGRIVKKKWTDCLSLNETPWDYLPYICPNAFVFSVVTASCPLPTSTVRESAILLKTPQNRPTKHYHGSKVASPTIKHTTTINSTMIIMCVDDIILSGLPEMALQRGNSSNTGKKVRRLINVANGSAQMRRCLPVCAP